MEARVDETLVERGNVYGNYSANAKSYGEILGAIQDIHINKHGTQISNKDMVAINYVVMKIVRLAATPNHLDSWHDIQGYAKLAEEMYKGEQDDK